MDWDRLRIFHIVADAGSFSHASEEINTSQSAISRQVSNLEYEVGMPLFHRHPRGLCLLYTSPSPRDVEETRMPSSA